MYRKKSEIIGHIQSYHRQVAKLYRDISEKTTDNEMKSLVNELCEHEESRDNYLERHRKIAEAMNCWLEFPCERLSAQITECFRNLELGTEITMEQLVKIEMHFDDCLIKLYNILSSENAMSETVANTFYYMLKKTEKEKRILATMLYNSGTSLKMAFSE
ncbi:MAG TPA: hypothetical protein PKJ71_04215 [Bacteroidales bacterium]|jgi:hypothetical protein|nr:hypothetical protein [Bacteroidales bacterium]HNT92887.1 hypothetical protein [Bacteroidales bacterium]